MDDGIGADLESEIAGLQDYEGAIRLRLDAFHGIEREPLGEERRREECVQQTDEKWGEKAV